jgi:N-acetyl-gamma-glutamyl-phosphate reductase
MVKIGILGASGYVGGELLRLLSLHPFLRAARVFGDSQAGAVLSDIHPHLALGYGALEVERFQPDRLENIDLLFAALPHGQTQILARTILGRGIPFIDLGADFRLRSAAAYETWYGEAHKAPDLLGSFVYGIPELNREAIRSSKAMAAAGCYPTATILALKPLIDAGLIERTGIVVDASSGVSGAGRAVTEATAFTAVAESLSAYGLVSHRHTAEMEESLDSQILFTPHLAPLNRGILATCYGRATRAMEPGEPLEALRSAYADEPFVHVTDKSPATKWTLGANTVQLTARYDPRTGRVIAVAALDNLVKGAAGQMIQCANLMLGFEETDGLPLCGVYP